MFVRLVISNFSQNLPQGRNGLGNIYVWASGDGGEDDDCNADGYAASMWTISINSAINDGQNAHYDESCTSTLASTFSNGGGDPKTGVATTDLYGRCTKTHSGTSAAAPEAAGVFALALEIKSVKVTENHTADFSLHPKKNSKKEKTMELISSIEEIDRLSTFPCIS